MIRSVQRHTTLPISAPTPATHLHLFTYSHLSITPIVPSPSPSTALTKPWTRRHTYLELRTSTTPTYPPSRSGTDHCPSLVRPSPLAVHPHARTKRTRSLSNSVRANSTPSSAVPAVPKLGHFVGCCVIRRRSVALGAQIWAEQSGRPLSPPAHPLCGSVRAHLTSSRRTLSSPPVFLTSPSHLRTLSLGCTATLAAPT